MTPLVAALIWFLLAAIPLALGGMAILEGALYLTNQTPITIYVRNWRNGHAWAAIGIGCGVVALVAVGITHFLLDA